MMSRPHSDLLHPHRPWWERRRYIYFGGTVLIVALSSYSQVLSVFRDQLQDYLNIGLKKYGLLMSAGAIPGAIGALGAGVLVHRAHPRAVIRASLVGAALGLVISIGSVATGVGVFLLTNAMARLGDHPSPPEQLWRILLLPAAGFPCVGIVGAIWLWRRRRARTAIERPEEG